MNIDRILDGLNPQQRRAAEAVGGPVCILAGAGSGKTTTITRRIALQVATETFEPGQILAVTFTDKAAGEMRGRLGALKVEGVRARTFHSAALAQLRGLATNAPGSILPSKAIALRQIANSLPKPYRFRPAVDLATEIEWAKNRRLTTHSYLDSLGSHEPPLPGDLMLGVWRAYESGKSHRDLIDFEDLLELTIRMFDEDLDALERFQARYRAFTVDEYQDVNLLQQSLLDRWLGERDDVCVVGDDYQSIYGFTGASPAYLMEMPRRWPRSNVVRLEANYRSTPEILDLANRLVPRLGGARKVLRATRPAGPAPARRVFFDPEREKEFVVERIRDLYGEGVGYEQMAVLYRVNFRSEDFEEAFSDAHIPFQVRGGAFLSRPAARRMMRVLTGRSAGVAGAVRKAADREGYREDLPSGIGEQELTRQKDLARLVVLAEEFDDGASTVADFVADLHARFGREGDGRGVNLLTYHRAKGLEFEAVFLPRLQEGEIPFKRSTEGEALAEERRLFYVGLTRARTHLSLSWLVGKHDASRFLDELGLLGGSTATKGEVVEDQPWPAAVQALKEWRRRRAKADGVPAYVVLHDSTVADLARRLPQSEAQLASVEGIGPAKLDKYGVDILHTIKSVST